MASAGLYASHLQTDNHAIISSLSLLQMHFQLPNSEQHLVKHLVLCCPKLLLSIFNHYWLQTRSPLFGIMPLSYPFQNQVKDHTNPMVSQWYMGSQNWLGLGLGFRVQIWNAVSVLTSTVLILTVQISTGNWSWQTVRLTDRPCYMLL